MIRQVLIGVALAFGAVNAHAGDATPLFSDDAIIDIRVIGPIKEIVRKASRSTDPYPATLELVGAAAETHAIELSARGLSRRESNVCQFPPLRVRFVEKPGAASLFRKQGSLKLVTHCRNSSSFQQHALLEYSAYRLLNFMTPASFRVRLANVDYVEKRTGKTIVKRVGFFIEDVDDLAKRVDLEEVERPNNDSDELDSDATAVSMLFQYMIGNLDWDVLFGPPSEPCCHNGKVIGPSAAAVTDLIVVPYDFDYSGLVDAPYAMPPENLKVKSVRTRLYRGFCRHNAKTVAAAALFRDQKFELLARLDETPGLTARSKSKAALYLDGFFKAIADEQTIDQKLLKKCR